MTVERQDLIHHQLPEETSNTVQSETPPSQGKQKKKRSHTPETRAKISVSHTGKTVSYETGAKISDSQRKRWVERKKQMQAASEIREIEMRKVEAMETARLIFSVGKTPIKP